MSENLQSAEKSSWSVARSSSRRPEQPTGQLDDVTSCWCRLGQWRHTWRSGFQNATWCPTVKILKIQWDTSSSAKTEAQPQTAWPAWRSRGGDATKHFCIFTKTHKCLLLWFLRLTFNISDIQTRGWRLNVLVVQTACFWILTISDFRQSSLDCERKQKNWL